LAVINVSIQSPNGVENGKRRWEMGNGLLSGGHPERVSQGGCGDRWLKAGRVGGAMWLNC